MAPSIVSGTTEVASCFSFRKKQQDVDKVLEACTTPETCVADKWCWLLMVVPFQSVKLNDRMAEVPVAKSHMCQWNVISSSCK